MIGREQEELEEGGTRGIRRKNDKDDQNKEGEVQSYRGICDLRYGGKMGEN